MDEGAPIVYRFVFRFESGREKDFVIRLDPESLRLIAEPREVYPEWTKISCCRCPNCPVPSDPSARCPVAENIIDLVEFFKDCLSYDKVDVRVETEERTYSKDSIALQKAVGSLLGIYMVTSGCPILERLKPMVRFHLPFASFLETTYRVITMYLMAQYLKARQGGVAEWDLKNLSRIYEEIRVVNESFAARLRTADIEDASLNAVVILDTFAMNTQFIIDDDQMEEISRLFSAYMQDPPAREHLR